MSLPHQTDPDEPDVMRSLGGSVPRAPTADADTMQGAAASVPAVCKNQRRFRLGSGFINDSRGLVPDGIRHAWFLVFASVELPLCNIASADETMPNPVLSVGPPVVDAARRVLMRGNLGCSDVFVPLVVAVELRRCDKTWLLRASGPTRNVFKQAKLVRRAGTGMSCSYRQSVLWEPQQDRFLVTARSRITIQSDLGGISCDEGCG
jgi:hypothetical protein